MITKPLPDIAILKALLKYERSTGYLRWRYRPRNMFKNEQAFHAWNTKYEGEVAGHLNKKTKRIAVKLPGRIVFAHRICFTMLKNRNLDISELPDHHDGNPSNNRSKNLLDADRSQNSCNRRKQNRPLPKGVVLHKPTGRYRAEIQFRGKRTYLGYFATPEEADAALRPVRIAIHGEFARHE